MATASAFGEFNNYVNKFWGATDIVVTYGTEAPFYPNQTLNKVLSDPLVRQTTQRLIGLERSVTLSPTAHSF